MSKYFDLIAQMIRAIKHPYMDLLIYMESSKRRQLQKFADIHSKEKRCFILGNGPSLKKQDLRLLKNEITFVTNWFVKYDLLDEVQANYYCSSDPVHWNWHGTGRFPEGIYEPLDRRSEIIKFFEHSAARVCRKQGVLLGPEVNFVRLDRTRRVADGHVSLDITRGVCWGGTVIVDFCLPMAYYMGFREFYLLGCDMDYALVDDKKEYQKDSYFYNVDAETGREAPKTLRTGEWQEMVFETYRVMKRVFEANGRKIYNATLGGKLEVFERVDFEQVVRHGPS